MPRAFLCGGALSNSRDANNATAVYGGTCCGDSSFLNRKKTEILSDLELHTVDLRQKSGRRRTVVHRVRLGRAEMGELLLEPGDA